MYVKGASVINDAAVEHDLREQVRDQDATVDAYGATYNTLATERVRALSTLSTTMGGPYKAIAAAAEDYARVHNETAAALDSLLIAERDLNVLSEKLRKYWQ